VGEKIKIDIWDVLNLRDVAVRSLTSIPQRYRGKRYRGKEGTIYKKN
jgi:hypothetical protein